ncbi:MAG: GntR family transcriptional regulator [Planctomycetes bacterium]|nr:GntR family transcriptional regulator [Planctomycetota bacterium]
MSSARPGPEPVRRVSLAQQVARSLRDAILDGRLAGGSVLRQSALARELGVSVIPLREALRQLEGEGLVRHEAHRGVVVATFDAEDVHEVVEISAALEAIAFPRALPRLEAADLERAEAALAALREETDLARFADLAWELRAALLRPAGRPRLLQTLETLSRSSRRYWAPFQRDAKARKWLFAHWERLLEAARRRDVARVLAQLEAARREGVELGVSLFPHTTPEAPPAPAGRRDESRKDA